MPVQADAPRSRVGIRGRNLLLPTEQSVDLLQASLRPVPYDRISVLR